MNNIQNENMEATTTTKRTYKKQTIVLKKFLDKDQKSLLTKMCKNHPKKVTKMIKEEEKSNKKAEKEMIKNNKKAEKEAEKNKIKELKEQAKKEKKEQKEAERKKVKEEKATAKKEAKEAKKKLPKDTSNGNVMSVLNLSQAEEPNLFTEALAETSEELSEEVFINVNEITQLANAPAPDEVKKKRRGRPKKANLEEIAPNAEV
tara:strand:+ start:109 stop:720 length:612 start_codon:yes stop_codon:yes gene_type:complete